MRIFYLFSPLFFGGITLYSLILNDSIWAKTQILKMTASNNENERWTAESVLNTLGDNIWAKKCLDAMTQNRINNDYRF